MQDGHFMQLVLKMGIATAIAACVFLFLGLAVTTADAPATRPAGDVVPTAPAGGAASAGPFAATVKSVTGKAQKLSAPANGNQPKWTDLKAGDTLDENTVIRTGLRSRVVITIADRGEMTVGSVTKIGIGQLRRGQTQHVRVRMGLKYGTLRAKVEKGPGGNDFKIATPTITASVGGSESTIGYAADGGFQIQTRSGYWDLTASFRRRVLRGGDATGKNLAMPLDHAQAERHIQVTSGFGMTSQENLYDRELGRGMGLVGLPGGRGTLDGRGQSGARWQRPIDRTRVQCGQSESQTCYWTGQSCVCFPVQGPSQTTPPTGTSDCATGECR